MATATGRIFTAHLAVQLGIGGLIDMSDAPLGNEGGYGVAEAGADGEPEPYQDLSTTQRYMHLSPAAIEGAIRLLDQPSPDLRRGDIVETGGL